MKSKEFEKEKTLIELKFETEKEIIHLKEKLGNKQHKQKLEQIQAELEARKEAQLFKFKGIQRTMDRKEQY